MLKDYLKDQHRSMYRLAEESGVAYSTVNDLANGRIEIQNCRAGILKDLARALSISMDELYELCSNEIEIPLESRKTIARIRVKNTMWSFLMKDSVSRLKYAG